MRKVSFLMIKSTIRTSLNFFLTNIKNDYFDSSLIFSALTTKNVRKRFQGAKPLQIPNYNPREMNNIIRFDAIHRTLLAISKPMYLCVMNEDPVMVAFKIAETCEKMASTLTVAKDELLAIKHRCEKFAADFIKHASTFEDLELILSQMTTEDENIVAPGNPFERLKYAMINNHMDFVANRSVQKLLKKKFYQGPIALNDFEGANMVKKSLYISALIMLTPVWLFLYTF